MSRTVALLQARMSSSRFPGKVIADLGGMPMIAFMIERVRAAQTIDETVVVTSVDPSDDPLAGALEGLGVPVIRGPLDDVLSRYAMAAERTSADVIVRLTGDCPLIDPEIIDSVVAARTAAGADYASNVDPPSFADGLDVECFTRAALDRADREARDPAEREHVTLWMRTAKAAMDRVNVVGLVDSSRLRLTVDYPDDLTVVRRLVDRLGGRPDGFDQFDILRCLSAEPDLLKANPHARNEGLLKPPPSSAT